MKVKSYYGVCQHGSYRPVCVKFKDFFKDYITVLRTKTDGLHLFFIMLSYPENILKTVFVAGQLKASLIILCQLPLRRH